jgi:hypothetical protein
VARLVQAITEALKTLASSLGIPVLLLAQLSRHTERREDHRHDQRDVDRAANVTCTKRRERFRTSPCAARRRRNDRTADNPDSRRGAPEATSVIGFIACLFIALPCLAALLLMPTLAALYLLRSTASIP